jgi:hypothetical protein
MVYLSEATAKESNTNSEIQLKCQTVTFDIYNSDYQQCHPLGSDTEKSGSSLPISF